MPTEAAVAAAEREAAGLVGVPTPLGVTVMVGVKDTLEDWEAVKVAEKVPEVVLVEEPHTDLVNRGLEGVAREEPEAKPTVEVLVLL